ncbi:MAG TPA: hypothetical protein VHV51_07120, partial [Polyangiaceae bacterium]|nr:hypothetical protein [Polyangiaceae bacterium]
MTNKRDPGEVSFFHQRSDLEGDNPSTLRSIEVADEIAAEVEELQPPVYVEPQPLALPSDHKTIEIETVKLAEDIDPRKLPTELRLARPPSVAPDSGALNELGLVSSQTSPLQRRRRRMPLTLALALLALLLLALVRVITQSTRAVQTAADAVPSAQPEPSATATSAEPAPPASAPEVAANSEPAPTASDGAPAANSAEPSEPEARTQKHS